MQRGRAWLSEGDFDRAFEMFQRVADSGGDLSHRAAYLMGKCRLRAGDFDASAEQLAAAIEKFPKGDLLAEMFYDRAIALVRGGRHNDAVKALGVFRARFPQHVLAADALQLLAAVEHQQRRFKQSNRYCREFLEKYPEHELAASVAFLSAENDFLAERYQEAVKSYRQLMSRYPDNPQAGKAKFRLGMGLYRLQRFDDAIPLLEEVTNGAGTQEVFRPALLALGDIHFQQGRWKKAERYLSDYLSPGADAPFADDALLKLGLSRQRQGRHQDALQSYGQLIDRFVQSPHRLQAKFERGQALVALDRFDEAVEDFEAVMSEGEDSRFTPYALNHMAAIATQRKEFTAASELYERVAQTTSEAGMGADALFQSAETLMAARQFKEADKAFDRFLDRYPSDTRATEARARRAIALARQDRHADALEVITQIERRVAAKLDPSLRAAVGYEKAWCLRELGRTEDAAKVYRSLIDERLDGDFNVHAVLELAGIEMNAKRFGEAAKLLRGVQANIESVPDSVPADLREQVTYRLAVCEFELDRYREASKLFEAFLDTFPESPLGLSAGFYGGDALFKLGRYEKAVKRLKRVAEECDDDPVCSPSVLRLGESLAALQRWARSEHVFTDYLDRFSDSEHWFQAQFGIGWARENQKRYDESISAYRQVVARHRGPTAARAQFQIGECLFAKKRYDEAVRELLKVDILYAYPKWSAAALYEAGRCFEKLGKPVEARHHFKQVLDQHKETRWAELASRRLSETAGTGLPGR